MMMASDMRKRGAMALALTMSSAAAFTPLWAQSTTTAPVDDPAVVATWDCRQAQQEAIERARMRAFVRLQAAAELLNGIVPVTPDNKSSLGFRRRQREAIRLARRLFGPLAEERVNLAGNVSGMRSKVADLHADKAKSFRCRPDAGGKCGLSMAYSTGFPPLIMCPLFFSNMAQADPDFDELEEERVRNIVHESAHLVGIHEPFVGGQRTGNDNETYCSFFECTGPCAGPNERIADYWSQFVHCLSGRPRDTPELIEAPAQRTSRP